MNIDDEIAYAWRREDAERRAHAAAADRGAADAHLRLAERYADRAWSLEERRHAHGGGAARS